MDKNGSVYLILIDEFMNACRLYFSPAPAAGIPIPVNKYRFTSRGETWYEFDESKFGNHLSQTDEREKFCSALERWIGVALMEKNYE